MPEIKPFAGYRYSTERFGKDLSALIAPPYDVLDAADKAALQDKHACNIVTIDLPHVPPKSAGPDEVYVRANETLRRWIADGTLIRDTQPAIYVYHQVYEYGGRQYTRKKFFARMRLEAFGTGTVFPHEKTFGGPKEDRFKLMQATQHQLSAVFGLYSDPDNGVSGILDVGSTEPDITAELENVTNKMWIVQDAATVQAVCTRLADRPVYIADGHHRYGTALNYRDSLGTIPADHPAHYVLVGFCAMEDPGALILPTHRVLSGFGSKTHDDVVAALIKGLKDVSQTSAPADANQILPANSPDDLALYLAGDNRVISGQFAQRDVLRNLAPEQSDAWRDLDVAYLHRYMIDELVTKNTLGGDEPKIQYIKLAADAVQAAKDTTGIALICKACTMAQLRAVSHAGDLMPQKTTFFYPKLATGLVLHPLT